MANFSQVEVNMVEGIIAFLIENAQARSMYRWSGVSFVKNELFINGAYRIHKQDFIACSMDTNDINKIIAECVEKYDFVEWDKSSLWLTIHIK